MAHLYSVMVSQETFPSKFESHSMSYSYEFVLHLNQKTLENF